MAFFAVFESGTTSAVSKQVTARQQVTAEISLTVASTSMTMLPAIPGLTGGTGNASTTVTVVTNNNTGFTVGFWFGEPLYGDGRGDDGYSYYDQEVGYTRSGPAALGANAYEQSLSGMWDPELNEGNYFFNYVPTNGLNIPENWVNTLAGGDPQFGYGITNISPNQVEGYELCNTPDSCFTGRFFRTIVVSDSETSVTGNSFVLKFRAHIPANSNPLLREDWYTATSTINVFMN